MNYLTPNFVSFKAQCEDLVKKSCAEYNKIIDQLQNELTSKDHIINKLLTAIGDLTSTQLKLTDNVIHKLIIKIIVKIYQQSLNK